MAALAELITAEPEQCGGRPCVRGLRIRVTDVLDLLASGFSQEQVLDELPDLEAADVSACLRFASRRVDRRMTPWPDNQLPLVEGRDPFGPA